MIRKTILLILTLALVCGCVSAAGLDGRAALSELKALMTENEPGESVSDWAALTGARMGDLDGREESLQGLWDYVSTSYRENGGLDTIKATVWQRIAMTVRALGADPTAFGEDAGGNPIDLIAEGTYNWDRTDSLGTQGTNAWIYALLTLDSGGYEVPEGARYTREDMIAGILSCQVEDGGFHIGSGMSDVDVTAMALQALAPYYEQEDVKERVDRALEFLSAAQTAQGTIGQTAEGCAQTVLALCSLGIDPGTDERFCKAGGSALNGLLLFHTDGGFSHTLGGEADDMATEQAARALCAYDLFQNGERFFNMTGIDAEPYTPATGFPVWLGVAGAAVLVWIIICIRKGKKTCTR